MTLTLQERWPELSDLVIEFSPDGTRRAVRVVDVVKELDDAGHRRSARLARSLPARGSFFDETAVDAVLLRSHLELQRLAEEIQHGQRVSRLLKPFLDIVGAPATVVDIGCGLGYLVRHFAASGVLGADTKVVGVDFNRTLLDAARHLATEEGLACDFIAGDAFELETPATVFISSGVIHHFPPGDLPGFFARQFTVGAKACFHFDVAPTWLSPLGAWMFHWARMREPLARHDGVRSALRAHTDQELARAIRTGAPDWDGLIFDAVGRRSAVLNVMRPIIGMDPQFVAAYRRQLGRMAPRLETP